LFIYCYFYSRGVVPLRSASESEKQEKETVMEAEEEQQRRLKIEEALEIQSLRRIISAYLK